jgi:hypothetical protein
MTTLGSGIFVLPADLPNSHTRQQLYAAESEAANCEYIKIATIYDEAVYYVHMKTPKYHRTHVNDTCHVLA